MKKTIFTLLLIAITSISVFSQEEEIKTNKEDKNLPDIFFKVKDHDFGTIQYKEEAIYKFKFTNTGKEPLLLTNVRSSCGCTVPTWPKKPIKPGKKGEIAVKYNTRILNSFSKSIMVFSNAKTSQVRLTIKGKVVNQSKQSEQ
ncbi:MAG: DUF1573 domain-containing protein [Bacteroidota bacterium]|nr:DUF1573 domain-containing protein [Bacteroidota bacterium]